MTDIPDLVDALGNQIWTLLNKAEMAAWKMWFRDPANVPKQAEVGWFADAVRADEYQAGKELVKKAADALELCKRQRDELEELWKRSAQAGLTAEENLAGARRQLSRLIAPGEGMETERTNDGST